MERDKGMAETVAAEMPSADEIAACAWLSDQELAVYAREYARTATFGNDDLIVVSGRAASAGSLPPKQVRSLNGARVSFKVHGVREDIRIATGDATT
jgi:hypothetical protein